MSWVVWVLLGMLVLAFLAYLALRVLGFCILSEWRDDRDEW